MNLSKIKDIAKDQGKTLGSVAAAVGITHAGLNTLMKENSTRVDTLLKIANYLGVSITEFFDEEDMHTSAPIYGNTATVGDRFRGQRQRGAVHRYEEGRQRRHGCQQPAVQQRDLYLRRTDPADAG